MEPRKKLPRGGKAILEKVTPTRAKLRMKNPCQSPPHLLSQSKEDGEDDDNGEFGLGEENKDKDYESENDGSKNKKEDESESSDNPGKITPPPLPSAPLQIKCTPVIILNQWG